jgi:hypothetical protein
MGVRHHYIFKIMETLPEQKPKVKFEWYQHIWLGWPIVMVAFGGAIGGGCGGAARAINRKVFLKTGHPVLRCVWTGLISVASMGVWLVLASLIVSLIHKRS